MSTDDDVVIEVLEEYPILPVARVLPFMDADLRSIAQIGEFRRGQPMIFVNARAMHDMQIHTSSTLRAEVGGLILGNFYAHGEIPFIYIERAIPALQAHSGSGSLVFTPDAVVGMDERRQADCPHLRSVGWYHSHPGFGIFLSSIDLHSHTTVFSNGPFVAVVLDPVAKTDGMFTWVDGKIAGPLAYWLIAR